LQPIGSGISWLESHELDVTTVDGLHAVVYLVMGINQVGVSTRQAAVAAMHLHEQLPPHFQPPHPPPQRAARGLTRAASKGQRRGNEGATKGQRSRQTISNSVKVLF
jgi:hypothetical protein